MSFSLFQNLRPVSPDANFAVAAEARAAGPQALDATIGVILDERGQPQSFRCVEEAAKRWATGVSGSTLTYPPLLGLPEFREAVTDLLYAPHPGTGAAVDDTARIASIATTGGTGALAVGLRLLRAMDPATTVMLPMPTWINHRQVIEEAGLRAMEIPYLPLTPVQGLRAHQGLERLTLSPGEREHAALLIQAGCHNPTGKDLSGQQWNDLCETLKHQKTTVLLDFPYQGLKGTPEEDRLPLRLLTGAGIPTIVCWSASKNHGLYGLRTGLTAVAAPDASTKTIIEGHFMRITRSFHSAASTVGQAIVADVQARHREEWLQELAALRATLARKRTRLQELLPQFHDALDGHGMFALLPLAPAAMLHLKQQRIFLTPDGRVNIAGIPEKRLEEFTEHISPSLLKGGG